MAWSEEDRQALLALLLDRSSKCPSCGTAADEWEEPWLDDGGQPVFDEVTGKPLTRRRQVDPFVPQVHKCWGCEVRATFARQREGERKRNGQGAAPGEQVILVPNPDL